MKKFIHTIAVMVVLGWSTATLSQNKPLLEVSLPISPLLDPELESVSLSEVIAVNYVFSPRFTAGVEFVYQHLATRHDVLEKTPRQVFGEIYTDHYDNNNEHVMQTIGGGINAKYNIINRPGFRLFSTIHLNYVKTSISQLYNDPRHYYQYDSSSYSIYVAGAVPYENQSAFTVNLDFGFDVRMFPKTYFYAIWNFQDIFQNLKCYYDVTVDYKLQPEEDNNQTLEVEKVTYHNYPRGEGNLIVNLQFGLRFYLFDKKL